MSSLPLSPPLNPSRRHTAPLLDNRKGEDQSRIRPELPAKLKPHAPAKSSTRVSTNAVFKMPALPVPRSTTSQAAANNAQATTTVPQNRSPVPINQSLPRPSLNENASSPAAHSMGSHPTQKANPPHGMTEGLGSGSRSRTTGQQSVGTANLLKENVAKDLGCENEAQMELHQRVNKHVNTYLKKACGIAGGYKLYTERQAWNVLSTLAPLDLATNPEVFEPLETDQLAKFLNHRRRSLEEFQEAKMPMPPLPLLPSTTPTDYMTDAQRENAKLSFQWGYQGVVNRGKWTITQSDLAMIKSELISLQKARKRFEGLPPMVLQLPPSEEIEGNGSPSIQPLKNSVKDFREMKNTYKLLPVDDTLDEMDTILGPNKLKVTDVCNLSLSITREEINMVKEELQQVAARKRISPEQRMRNVVLSSSWERSSEEVPMNLNMEQYCLSPPLAPLKKDATTTQAPLREVLYSINVSSTASLLRTSRHSKSANAIAGTQKLLDIVEPLSPSFFDERYMLNSDTPTLAASSSVDEDTSSLPASPTRQGARIAKECQDSVLQYQGPVMDAWEEEKLEVPLLHKRKHDYLNSTTFHESFPTLCAGHSILPISSSPEEEVRSLVEAPGLPTDRLARNFFRRKVGRDSKPEMLTVDLPGMTTFMSGCGISSDYMKVPNLPSMTRVNPYRTATFMPQSLKDFTSAKNAKQTGVMAPCKGVQSLAYELAWSISLKEFGSDTASDLLSQPTLLSPETCSLPASLRQYQVQECLLRPPSPAAVVEYAIGQLEPSANQSQQLAHDQPRSVLPCDTSSFTSPSNQITKVSELTEEGHGVSKKRRTGHKDKSRIAPPIKVAETEKLARLKAPSVEQRPNQRSYNNIETELDELIYERDHGVNENETEKQEYKLPPSQISRYMLAREPASCRDMPAYSSSPSVTFRNAEGMKPLKTSSEGDYAENLETPLHDNALKLGSRPTNPRDISESIENVIQSARTLPVLPIMVNTSIYNKRHLCSALHALQFQLYGHDHLEADFILNLKTACILVPLAYISANAEELLEKLVTLAFSFENLIVIFDLYPSRTNSTNQAALPDPWSPSTKVAFTQFEGRLKRQIMWKVASDSGFQHRINVYLSDNASTEAALLRLHANDESMPAGTSVYRHLDENDIGDTFAWLSMDMEAEECQIRDGLQLNSAAALYIAHEYGAAAFLEACQSRNNDMELFDLLGSWNMKTTGDVVRSRAAEAKRVEDEESVTGIQSQVEDGFSAISSGEHHYTSLQDAGRQMFDVPPIAFVSNDNSSYGTDFEDIAVDQDLQVGGYPSAEHGPAYLQEPGPAFTTVTTNEEEPDELNLRYFDWN